MATTKSVVYGTAEIPSATVVERYRCLKRTANQHEFEPCDTDGEEVHAISYEASASGNVDTITTVEPRTGIAKLEAGAAITAPARVKTGADNRIIAAADANDFVVGTVTEDAVEGRIVEVQLGSLGFNSN